VRCVEVPKRTRKDAPTALRLFYRFFSRQGYLDDPEPMIRRLHAIELAFITLVKQRS
jgi:hypothetical protein